MSGPRRDTVIYDGDCALCRAAVGSLLRSAPPGSVDARSFRDEGVLAAFPGLVAERCEQAVHVVRADGEVLQGAGAIAALAQGRWWGRTLLRARRLRLLRRATDAAYAWIARNRHRARFAARAR